MDFNLLPNEKIKQIEGYPHYYITTFGRVWSDYRGGHWLKPTLNTRGNHQRYYVSLGRGHKKYIHRLVAEAFIPNPNDLPEVDHIDTDSTNNHVENLRWATREQNLQNELTQEHIKNNTGYYCEIEEIATGKLFIGYTAAAEYFHVHEETIRNHTKNKVKNPRWRLTGRRIRPDNI